MFKINFGSATQKKVITSSEDENSADDVYVKKEFSQGRIFLRNDTIEEEPNSMDSIISNPASFPITVMPSSMVRSATQNSISKFSRQSSSR